MQSGYYKVGGLAENSACPSLSILKSKSMPGTTIHSSVSTFSEPGSGLGTWMQRCVSFSVPGEARPGDGENGHMAPHQIEAHAGMGEGGKEGSDGLPLHPLWIKRTPLWSQPPRQTCPPHSRPPPGHHCACQPGGGTGVTGRLEMLFSSLSYTQCPRKTFC